MKKITEIDLQEKRVLIRVDFNVPLDPEGQITDDSRITAVLPTLNYILEHQGKLIIASHLGRPKGKKNATFSLRPIVRRLSELLRRPVKFAEDCIGPAVTQQVSNLSVGDVLLLENLRFHPEEEKNDDGFARELASLCDVYINDAFAVSHRANASVEGIVRQVAVAGGGFLMEKEISYFQMALKNPRRPLAAIVGGAKVSGKLGVLENLLGVVDKLIIGGAMANTFLTSLGLSTGSSLVEPDLIQTAESILQRAKEHHIPVYLPVDVVVAQEMKPDAATWIVPVQEIPKECMALDIGPATRLLFGEALDRVETIVWNGPMGVFEMDAFHKGTIELANVIACLPAVSIIGGGDTGAAVRKSGKADQMTYISTGGGAFLELMEGKILPGVAALESIH